MKRIEKFRGRVTAVHETGFADVKLVPDAEGYMALDKNTEPQLKLEWNWRMPVGIFKGGPELLGRDCIISVEVDFGEKPV